VPYSNENHRALAQAAAQWLAADGLEYGTDEEEDPTGFFILESRGAVFVEAIGEAVLISCRWLLLQNAPANIEMYEWALTQNSSLLVGRLTLEHSSIWYKDIILPPTERDQFSFHVARGISEVSRLRQELTMKFA
jgi:hypothetical protein